MTSLSTAAKRKAKFTIFFWSGRARSLDMVIVHDEDLEQRLTEGNVIIEQKERDGNAHASLPTDWIALLKLTVYRTSSDSNRELQS